MLDYPGNSAFYATALLLVFLAYLQQTTTWGTCVEKGGNGYICVSLEVCAKTLPREVNKYIPCGQENEGICCPVINRHSPPRCGIRKPRSEYRQKPSTFLEPSLEKSKLNITREYSKNASNSTELNGTTDKNSFNVSKVSLHTPAESIQSVNTGSAISEIPPDISTSDSDSNRIKEQQESKEQNLDDVRTMTLNVISKSALGNWEKSTTGNAHENFETDLNTVTEFREIISRDSETNKKPKQFNLDYPNESTVSQKVVDETHSRTSEEVNAISGKDYTDVFVENKFPNCSNETKNLTLPSEKLNVGKEARSSEKFLHDIDVFDEDVIDWKNYSKSSFDKSSFNINHFIPFSESQNTVNATSSRVKEAINARMKMDVNVLKTDNDIADTEKDNLTLMGSNESLTIEDSREGFLDTSTNSTSIRIQENEINYRQNDSKPSILKSSDYFIETSPSQTDINTIHLKAGEDTHSVEVSKIFIKENKDNNSRNIKIDEESTPIFTTEQNSEAASDKSVIFRQNHVSNFAGNLELNESKRFTAFYDTVSLRKLQNGLDGAYSKTNENRNTFSKINDTVITNENKNIYIKGENMSENEEVFLEMFTNTAPIFGTNEIRALVNDQKSSIFKDLLDLNHTTKYETNQTSFNTANVRVRKDDALITAKSDKNNSGNSNWPSSSTIQSSKIKEINTNKRNEDTDLDAENENTNIGNSNTNGKATPNSSNEMNNNDSVTEFKYAPVINISINENESTLLAYDKERTKIPYNFSGTDLDNLVIFRQNEVRVFTVSKISEQSISKSSDNYYDHFTTIQTPSQLTVFDEVKPISRMEEIDQSDSTNTEVKSSVEDMTYSSLSQVVRSKTTELLSNSAEDKVVLSRDSLTRNDMSESSKISYKNTITVTEDGGLQETDSVRFRQNEVSDKTVSKEAIFSTSLGYHSESLNKSLTVNPPSEVPSKAEKYDDDHEKFSMTFSNISTASYENISTVTTDEELHDTDSVRFRQNEVSYMTHSNDEMLSNSLSYHSEGVNKSRTVDSPSELPSKAEQYDDDHETFSTTSSNISTASYDENVSTVTEDEELHETDSVRFRQNEVSDVAFSNEGMLSNSFAYHSEDLNKSLTVDSTFELPSKAEQYDDDYEIFSGDYDLEFTQKETSNLKSIADKNKPQSTHITIPMKADGNSFFEESNMTIQATETDGDATDNSSLLVSLSSSKSNLNLTSQKESISLYTESIENGIASKNLEGLSKVLISSEDSKNYMSVQNASEIGQIIFTKKTNDFIMDIDTNTSKTYFESIATSKIESTTSSENIFRNVENPETKADYTKSVENAVDEDFNISLYNSVVFRQDIRDLNNNREASTFILPLKTMENTEEQPLELENYEKNLINDAISVNQQANFTSEIGRTVLHEMTPKANLKSMKGDAILTSTYEDKSIHYSSTPKENRSTVSPVAFRTVEEPVPGAIGYLTLPQIEKEGEKSNVRVSFSGNKVILFHPYILVNIIDTNKDFRIDVENKSLGFHLQSPANNIKNSKELQIRNIAEIIASAVQVSNYSSTSNHTILGGKTEVSKDMSKLTDFIYRNFRPTTNHEDLSKVEGNDEFTVIVDKALAKTNYFNEVSTLEWPEKKFNDFTAVTVTFNVSNIKENTVGSVHETVQNELSHSQGLTDVSESNYADSKQFSLVGTRQKLNLGKGITKRSIFDSKLTQVKNSSFPAVVNVNVAVRESNDTSVSTSENASGITSVRRNHMTKNIDLRTSDTIEHTSEMESKKTETNFHAKSGNLWLKDKPAQMILYRQKKTPGSAFRDKNDLHSKFREHDFPRDLGEPLASKENYFIEGISPNKEMKESYVQNASGDNVVMVREMTGNDDLPLIEDYKYSLGESVDKSGISGRILEDSNRAYVNSSYTDVDIKSPERKSGEDSLIENNTEKSSGLDKLLLQEDIKKEGDENVNDKAQGSQNFDYKSANFYPVAEMHPQYYEASNNFNQLTNWGENQPRHYYSSAQRNLKNNGFYGSRNAYLTGSLPVPFRGHYEANYIPNNGKNTFNAFIKQYPFSHPEKILTEYFKTYYNPTALQNGYRLLNKPIFKNYDPILYQKQMINPPTINRFRFPLPDQYRLPSHLKFEHSLPRIAKRHLNMFIDEQISEESDSEDKENLNSKNIHLVNLPMANILGNVTTNSNFDKNMSGSIFAIKNFNGGSVNAITESKISFDTEHTEKTLPSFVVNETDISVLTPKLFHYRGELRKSLARREIIMKKNNSLLQATYHTPSLMTGSKRDNHKLKSRFHTPINHNNSFRRKKRKPMEHNFRNTSVRPKRIKQRKWLKNLYPGSLQVKKPLNLGKRQSRGNQNGTIFKNRTVFRFQVPFQKRFRQKMEEGYRSNTENVIPQFRNRYMNNSIPSDNMRITEPTKFHYIRGKKYKKKKRRTRPSILRKTTLGINLLTSRKKLEPKKKYHSKVEHINMIYRGREKSERKQTRRPNIRTSHTENILLETVYATEIQTTMLQETNVKSEKTAKEPIKITTLTQERPIKKMPEFTRKLNIKSEKETEDFMETSISKSHPPEIERTDSFQTTGTKLELELVTETQTSTSTRKKLDIEVKQMATAKELMEQSLSMATVYRSGEDFYNVPPAYGNADSHNVSDQDASALRSLGEEQKQGTQTEKILERIPYSEQVTVNQLELSVTKSETSDVEMADTIHTTETNQEMGQVTKMREINNANTEAKQNHSKETVNEVDIDNSASDYTSTNRYSVSYRDMAAFSSFEEEQNQVTDKNQEISLKSEQGAENLTGSSITQSDASEMQQADTIQATGTKQEMQQVTRNLSGSNVTKSEASGIEMSDTIQKTGTDQDVKQITEMKTEANNAETKDEQSLSKETINVSSTDLDSAPSDYINTDIYSVSNQDSFTFSSFGTEQNPEIITTTTQERSIKSEQVTEKITGASTVQSEALKMEQTDTIQTIGTKQDIQQVTENINESSTTKSEASNMEMTSPIQTIGSNLQEMEQLTEMKTETNNTKTEKEHSLSKETVNVTGVDLDSVPSDHTITDRQSVSSFAEEENLEALTQIIQKISIKEEQIRENHTGLSIIQSAVSEMDQTSTTKKAGTKKEMQEVIEKLAWSSITKSETSKIEMPNTIETTEINTEKERLQDMKTEANNVRPETEQRFSKKTVSINRTDLDSVLSNYTNADRYSASYEDSSAFSSFGEVENLETETDVTRKINIKPKQGTENITGSSITQRETSDMEQTETIPTTKTKQEQITKMQTETKGGKKSDTELKQIQNTVTEQNLWKPTVYRSNINFNNASTDYENADDNSLYFVDASDSVVLGEDQKLEILTDTSQEISLKSEQGTENLTLSSITQSDASEMEQTDTIQATGAKLTGNLSGSSVTKSESSGIEMSETIQRTETDQDVKQITEMKTETNNHETEDNQSHSKETININKADLDSVPSDYTNTDRYSVSNQDGFAFSSFGREKHSDTRSATIQEMNIELQQATETITGARAARSGTSKMKHTDTIRTTGTKQYMQQGTRNLTGSSTTKSEASKMEMSSAIKTNASSEEMKQLIEMKTEINNTKMKTEQNFLKEVVAFSGADLDSIPSDYIKMATYYVSNQGTSAFSSFGEEEIIETQTETILEISLNPNQWKGNITDSSVAQKGASEMEQTDSVQTTETKQELERITKMQTETNSLENSNAELEQNISKPTVYRRNTELNNAPSDYEDTDNDSVYFEDASDWVILGEDQKLESRTETNQEISIKSEQGTKNLNEYSILESEASNMEEADIIQTETWKEMEQVTDIQAEVTSRRNVNAEIKQITNAEAKKGQTILRNLSSTKNNTYETTIKDTLTKRPNTVALFIKSPIPYNGKNDTDKEAMKEAVVSVITTEINGSYEKAGNFTDDKGKTSNLAMNGTFERPLNFSYLEKLHQTTFLSKTNELINFKDINNTNSHISTRVYPSSYLLSEAAEQEHKFPAIMEHFYRNKSYLPSNFVSLDSEQSDEISNITLPSVLKGVVDKRHIVSDKYSQKYDKEAEEANVSATAERSFPRKTFPKVNKRDNSETATHISKPYLSFASELVKTTETARQENMNISTIFNNKNEKTTRTIFSLPTENMNLSFPDDKLRKPAEYMNTMFLDHTITTQEQIENTQTPLLIPKSSEKGSNVPPKDFDFLETDPSFSRTIGGRLEYQPWPWMVSVYRSSDMALICAGTLIDEIHVLSAAHCFINHMDEKLVVSVGNLLKISKPSEGIMVEKVIVHEGFDPPCYCNDIAVLRLAKYLGPEYVPACLPDYDTATVGDNVTVLGWGDRKFLKTGGPSGTRRLQKVKGLPIVPPKYCRNAIQKILDIDLPEEFEKYYLCAGVDDGSKDACLGDSGGPLLHESFDGTWTVLGIVSFGFKCGEPGVPGTYSRVSYYMPWIMMAIHS